MTSAPRSLLDPRRGRWFSAAAFAAALFVAVGGVGSAVASPAVPSATAGQVVSTSTDDVVWTVTPADADGPDGRVSLRHELDPGATVTDALAVTNVGASAAEFLVQAGDGVVGTDGAFDIRATEGDGPGAWIAVDGLTDGAILVEGGETRILPLTISIPTNALPGDHPAGIVVGISQTGDDMAVQHRVGVRAHLQVTGDLVPALEISDVSTSYAASFNPLAPGVLRVDYTVANTGNVRLGASDGAAAAGPFGLGTVESSASEPAELLPGATATRTQEFEISPLVVLFGEVTVTPVAIGEDAVALPPALTAGFQTVAVPWAILIALLVVAGLVVLAAWTRRRAAKKTQDRIDEAVAAARRTDAADVAPAPEHAGARS